MALAMFKNVLKRKLYSESSQNNNNREHQDSADRRSSVLIDEDCFIVDQPAKKQRKTTSNVDKASLVATMAEYYVKKKRDWAKLYGLGDSRKNTNVTTSLSNSNGTDAKVSDITKNPARSVGISIPAISRPVANNGISHHGPMASSILTGFKTINLESSSSTTARRTAPLASTNVHRRHGKSVAPTRPGVDKSTGSLFDSPWKKTNNLKRNDDSLYARIHGNGFSTSVYPSVAAASGDAGMGDIECVGLQEKERYRKLLGRLDSIDSVRPNATRTSSSHHGNNSSTLINSPFGDSSRFIERRRKSQVDQCQDILNELISDQYGPTPTTSRQFSTSSQVAVTTISDVFSPLVHSRDINTISDDDEVLPVTPFGEHLTRKPLHASTAIIPTRAQKLIPTSSPGSQSIIRPDLSRSMPDLKSGLMFQVEHSPYLKNKYVQLKQRHKANAKNFEAELEVRRLERQKSQLAREDETLRLMRSEGIYVFPDEPQEQEDVEAEFPALTVEHEEMIDSALSGENIGSVFADKFNIKIHGKDLRTLKGLNWLNDNIVNFYLNLIQQRSIDDENLPNVYVQNTFFYTNISQKGYASVKRWTRKVDVFSFQKMIVPVHLGVHWCLASIDFTKKEMCYFDSMGGGSKNCLNHLRDYIEEEHKDKKKSPFNFCDWKYIDLQEIPMQQNGSDCGMFLCKFAEYFSRNADITFTQEHMPYFRDRMIVEIMDKNLW